MRSFRHWPLHSDVAKHGLLQAETDHAKVVFNNQFIYRLHNPISCVDVGVIHGVIVEDQSAAQLELLQRSDCILFDLVVGMRGININ